MLLTVNLRCSGAMPADASPMAVGEAVGDGSPKCSASMLCCGWAILGQFSGRKCFRKWKQYLQLPQPKQKGADRDGAGAPCT